MPELVVRGSYLAFARGGLIFIPKLVVRGSSHHYQVRAYCPTSRGGHFELSSAILSFSTRAQILVVGLGPDHAYSIGSRLGLQ